MLTLPSISYAMQKNRKEIVAMRGINYSDQLQDGDLAHSLNLSARRFPYITTRKARAKQEAYASVTALTAWDKLVAVRGTDLLYDGAVVGQVTEGEKQFAVVNTRLVIWPDQVYLDLNTSTVKPLGASLSGAGATFTTDTMTIAWQLDGEAVDLTEYFKAGDAVTITGCTANEANNKDIVIKEITATTVTVTENGFVEATESGAEIKLERTIPALDFICESQNRLWGVSSEKQTIYASALGDPTNFNVFEGLSTDSYALAVGSEGNFTGCCKLSSSVLFWKETKLHKILGNYPAEYSLYTYDIEGLQAGCHKSMQVINEVLFYMGLHGVYAYSGGTPSLMSANFGDHNFTGAVAGNDGDSYYLSVTEGENVHMMVYETRAGIWVREDSTRAVDFARIGRSLYFLDDKGDVWLADSPEDDPNVEWEAQFTPFYETIQGRKTYSRMMLRLELPQSSYMIAEARSDGKLWKECGKVVGRENDTVSLRIALNRCDKFEIRLRGKGPCTILSMLREFSVGSEV